MKTEKHKLARKLRYSGWSVRSIAKKINCSKSSISKWVEDIPLTEKQIEVLRLNQDRARAKAAKHPNSPRNKWAVIREKVIKEAFGEIKGNPSRETLRILGAALYWAEGYNASRNSFVFANSDSSMIKLMMRFLEEICKAPLYKLRGRVNIHPHLNIKEAHKHWSNISGIPLGQFHKPLLSVSRASKQKRYTLPYGTFRIIISDVILCSKIKGWIEGIKIWGD